MFHLPGTLPQTRFPERAAEAQRRGVDGMLTVTRGRKQSLPPGGAGRDLMDVMGVGESSVALWRTPKPGRGPVHRDSPEASVGGWGGGQA